MLDRLVQLGEMVAWYCSIHMVLCMVVHMPVPEAHQRVVEVESARVQPEVIHCFSAKVSVGEPNVLRGVAKPKEPPIVKRPQTQKKWGKILASHDAEVGKGTMSEKHELCPAHGWLARCRVVSGIAYLLPAWQPTKMPNWIYASG